jgi:hypothetical protein
MLAGEQETEWMESSRQCEEAGAYHIKVQGYLEEKWSDWFDGFEIHHLDDETLLKGIASDQAALHGLLNKIRDLGMTLLLVQRIEAETQQEL